MSSIFTFHPNNFNPYVGFGGAMSTPPQTSPLLPSIQQNQFFQNQNQFNILQNNHPVFQGFPPRLDSFYCPPFYEIPVGNYYSWNHQIRDSFNQYSMFSFTPTIITNNRYGPPPAGGKGTGTATPTPTPAPTPTPSPAPFQLADVTDWLALDMDHDGKVDALYIEFGLDDDITIYNYFDNTSANPQASGAGTGLIEQIVFADNANVDFAYVQFLIATA